MIKLLLQLYNIDKRLDRREESKREHAVFYERDKEFKIEKRRAIEVENNQILIIDLISILIYLYYSLKPKFSNISNLRLTIDLTLDFTH